MANRLYKYNGFDEATNTILSGWDLNDAFIWGDESVYSGYTGYTDITSITEIDAKEDKVTISHTEVRDNIKNIFDTDGIDWSGYTTDEKKVLSTPFFFNLSVFVVRQRQGYLPIPPVKSL